MEKPAPPRRVALFCLLLAVSVFLAWSDSFRVPFLYDDHENIVASPSIRHLWPLSGVLFPPLGSHAGGRPLFNLSLAVNYSISGLSVWSYHLFNVFVHAWSALFLFGLARRTLRLPGLAGRFGRDADVPAFFTALLWAVHPLHTDAVTCISQRAESMMGLFFLASLYCALRGWEAGRSWKWHFLAGLVFLAGVGTKEVVVALPLVLLAYEWTFFGRRPARAARGSPVLYGGCALGLCLLALLVGWGATREVTPVATAGRFSYLATQAQVIVHYLRTAFWPSGLCLDYGWPIISFTEALPYGIAVLSLLAFCVRFLIHRHPAGFLGAWFFLILAPTSSIMPLFFPAWDRRMYLPLAAVAALVVVGGRELGRRGLAGLGKGSGGRAAGIAGLALALAASLVLAGSTWVRNQDYATEISIWRDVVAKRPDNHWGHSCLASAWLKERNALEAERSARAALGIRPDFTDALGNLAFALRMQGRIREATEVLREAVDRLPANRLARFLLAEFLLAQGDSREAMIHFRAAAILDPGAWGPVNGMGLAREMEGNRQEAADCFRRAAEMDSTAWEPRANLGRMLTALGKPREAIALLARARSMAPEVPGIHRDLGEALLAAGRLAEAEAELRRAARELRTARVFRNLGTVLLAQGDHREASLWFGRALALDPGHGPALSNLAAMGNLPDAQAGVPEGPGMGFDFSEAGVYSLGQ